MAYITSSVEYAIHCLLFLVNNEDKPLSSKDLAELQGVSPSFMAKIFPKLEKAGLVIAQEGVRGGYLLARSAHEIIFLDIVNAIEGEKPLFECQEVREKCAVFNNAPPDWATSGVCAVHAVMLQAEKAMRDALGAHTLGDIADRFGRYAPDVFFSDVNGWINERIEGRTAKMRKSKISRDTPD
ncbi:RrF2 family transcriptional regulator [Acinetobacter pittii]|uniref:RrF2 family transcriptional regulator n=1 Tax=Acinetobacter pittii TaxID=48296 RepID=UPI00355C11C8